MVRTRSEYLLLISAIEETRRIVAAGGFVEYGRVNGNLALSRALGDFEFKTNATLGPDDQIVTGRKEAIFSLLYFTVSLPNSTLTTTLFLANPAIVEHKIQPDDEFLILACDGNNILLYDRLRSA